MTKLLTAVGVFALAAAAVAFPAHARPKGGDQQACIDRCNLNPGRNGSVEQCVAICRATVNNARATAAHRTSNTTTINNGGNGTGNRRH
ncbi:MAG TPA: hypothetical protein VKX28_20705 [Xanthobacteraceae bacterium]|nr:hypothetical protein [Xanthobacteraceae bacterium]